MGLRCVAAASAVIAVAFGASAAARQRDPAGAAEPLPPSVRVYDPDPSHLWNRLHAALFVRTVADGHQYGADRVDPLLWIGSTHLLMGASHQRAVDVLNEFVSSRGERLIRDDVKRAVLQRDLWTIFDWLEGGHIPFGGPPIRADAVERVVAELRAPLATIIGRLALTPERIRRLPDNYTAASRAGVVPVDLLAPDGPWVSVGRPDGPVAVQHVRDAGPGKNSVFLVFLRLPGGRAATRAYLERLRSFDGPMWTDEGYPNPAIPQFPVGAQVALVRRALLVDASGEITPSSITEEVQVRTYREIRPMTSREFEDAHRIDEDMFSRAGQDFDEQSLSRVALFAGRAGGLRALPAEEPFFLTFASHGVDPFEEPRFAPASGAAARHVCKDCHAVPGIYSFNSYLPFRFLRPGASTRPAKLDVISLTDAERVAVAWKAQQPDWRTLRSLLRP